MAVIPDRFSLKVCRGPIALFLIVILTMSNAHSIGHRQNHNKEQGKKLSQSLPYCDFDYYDPSCPNMTPAGGQSWDSWGQSWDSWGQSWDSWGQSWDSWEGHVGTAGRVMLGQLGQALV